MVLQGAGVRHISRVAGRGQVLARFDEGSPALVEVPVGQGAIYYLAIPLVQDSMVEVLNRLMARVGLSRPVRFLTASGKRVPGLEYRAIKTPGGWLAYVNNLNRQEDCQMHLSSEILFRSIWNLTLEKNMPLNFTVPAGENYLLKLME